MEQIEVALVGAGRMGQVHGPNAAAHPGLHLKYIIDARPGVAEAMAARCGAAVATLEQALADPAIAGLLVCSTTDQHLTHALAAVRAGKAVFCEKPVGLDLAEVREAEPLFDGARFLLGFNRRFDPHFRALHRRLADGEIGELETLHLVNHDPAPPPPGFIPGSGGLFRDFSIHDLDLARWLLGEDPCEVFAMASCLVDPEIGAQGDVDTARILLRTPRGRLCVISNTRRSGCGYDQRVEAYGSAGRLAAGNVALDTVVSLDATGSHGAPIQPDFQRRYPGAYRAQLDHFADVLHGRADPAVGYADGVAALALADACARSVEAGAVIAT